MSFGHGWVSQKSQPLGSFLSQMCWISSQNSFILSAVLPRPSQKSVITQNVACQKRAVMSCCLFLICFFLGSSHSKLFKSTEKKIATVLINTRIFITYGFTSCEGIFLFKLSGIDNSCLSFICWLFMVTVPYSLFHSDAPEDPEQAALRRQANNARER